MVSRSWAFWDEPCTDCLDLLVQLSAADLEAPIDNGGSPTPPIPSPRVNENGNSYTHNGLPSGARTSRLASQPSHRTSTDSARPPSAASSLSIPGGFEMEDVDETDDWGGDLIDINDDDDD